MGLISRVSSRTYRKYDFENITNMAENNYPALTAYMTWRKGFDVDPRFRGVNHKRECQMNYKHFFQCEWVMKDKGHDVAPCAWFKKQYENQCPPEWIARWDEYREDGLYFGKFYEGMDKNNSPSINRTQSTQERYDELMASERWAKYQASLNQ